MNLQDITNDSTEDQLAEALNNSSVEIQRLSDMLKEAKQERAEELKRIIGDRGDFQSGSTKFYMGEKKKSKQANPKLIIEEIAAHEEDIFSAIVNCLGANAFKKGSTQKLIGKNETLFWDEIDEKVIEKVVKEVNTDFL